MSKFCEETSMKPSELSRLKATQRESRRQQVLREAFEELRKILPWNWSDPEQPPRRQILRKAIEYIAYLNQQLEQERN